MVRSEHFSLSSLHCSRDHSVAGVTLRSSVSGGDNRDSDIRRSIVGNLPRMTTNVRILVHNRGREAAQHVEVLVTDLYRGQPDGSYQLFDGFIPTPLKWTHSDQARCEYFHRANDCVTWAFLKAMIYSASVTLVSAFGRPSNR